MSANALKAQEQSRKTLVALGELKNPTRSTTFIKNYVDKQLNQMNIEPTKPSNQMQLQKDNHALLDIASKTESTSVDTAMAAVEIQQRSKKRSWKNSK